MLNTLLILLAMPDYSLPSSQVESWRQLFHQYGSDSLNCYQLYCLQDGVTWQPIFAPCDEQSDSEGLLEELTQLHAQINPMTIQCHHINTTESQHLTCPIWRENGVLFGFLVAKTQPSVQTNAKDSIEILCAKVSYDLSQLFVPTPGSLPTLQEFIDSLEDHTWIKSADGQYLMCNHSVEQAWGLSTDKIVGKYDNELFDQELAKKFADTDNVVIESGKQFIVEECPSEGKDNESVWLETIKSPVNNRKGEPLGVLGMTRNVTRRKMVENQLELASKIFNNSQEGMLITDSRANIIDVNAAFTTITGYDAKDVIGRNPKILQSGHHDDEFYKQLWEQLNNKGQWKGEFINRRKDNSVYPQIATISAVQDDHQQLINYICVFEDITTQRAHEEKLEKMAFYDPLTELPNRSHIISLLGQQIKHDQAFATLFMDIDHFKHINDSLGHYSGDQILIELADRLKHTLRHHDHIARIGGDEFVIVLTEYDDTENLKVVIHKILSLFNQPFSPLDTQSLRLSTSIGVALYPQDGNDTDTLLKNADTAMYKAKKNGRNGYAFYTPDLTTRSVSHVRLQSALHEAIELNQLSLRYQPQYNLRTMQLLGFEALLRWYHPQFGFVSPEQFIPVAEKAGLINQIGEWVLTEACKQGRTWLDRGYNFERLAVNVSAIQLQHSGFTNRLKQILQQTAFPADHLEIEITEGFFMQDPTQAANYLNDLRSLGVVVSLDDFGTGYSSLSYLKGLPLDKLKIDRSFISDVPNNPDINAIVNAILAMGKSLSLTVIAEGIETQAQHEYLLDHGCSCGQGFHLGKPGKPEAQTRLLEP
ncbi:EAL domain-containing protein [Vibrio sp. DBSS07]|uniref:cyclic-guanylate-specific phosphodiesterase n=2 Tax=Vibrio paucivorans TaxID=2829489 RepID=A0A9X3CDE9_9VIBR|nr:EAL domain-containing protein [Vibrio paucivorans]MCW8333170.1 EAL domain-containing protein [Vibrio paucivorans]